jgi:hypothetical protein
VVSGDRLGDVVQVTELRVVDLEEPFEGSVFVLKITERQESIRSDLGDQVGHNVRATHARTPAAMQGRTREISHSHDDRRAVRLSPIPSSDAVGADRHAGREAEGENRDPEDEAA